METIEDQVKKLEDVLQRFKKIIPTAISKHKGEHCKFVYILLKMITL